MLYIAICDDDPGVLDDLQERVRACLALCGELTDIRLYPQAQMLLYDIQEGCHLDLILSDIEMPRMDGMELVREIRREIGRAHV